MSESGLENETMTDMADGADDVDWRAILNLLRQGKPVEIPCAGERDYARKTKQLVKKAGKRDIVVDVQRGEGVLRVEPRPAASATASAQDAAAGETPTPPQ